MVRLWMARVRRVIAGVTMAMLVVGGALIGPAPTPVQATAKLAIDDIALSCECGGAGYLWGWRVVGISFFDSVRQGHTYKVSMKGGPTIATGTIGHASFSRDDVDFTYGKTYSFTLKEFKGKKLVRTSAPREFKIPKPVAHPRRAHIDTLTLDEGEAMVAGETYRITFDGTWAEGIRFASGVDRYFGTDPDDDRFGYYAEDGYPLPWDSSSEQPIVEFTPTEEFIGTTWNIQLVGYRPAPRGDRDSGLKKGDPVKGSEWGYTFSVRVISADEVPAES